MWIVVVLSAQNPASVSRDIITGKTSTCTMMESSDSHPVVVNTDTVYIPSSANTKGDSAFDVNPFGPVQEYVPSFSGTTLNWIESPSQTWSVAMISIFMLVSILTIKASDVSEGHPFSNAITCHDPE